MSINKILGVSVSEAETTILFAFLLFVVVGKPNNYSSHSSTYCSAPAVMSSEYSLHLFSEQMHLR